MCAPGSSIIARLAAFTNSHHKWCWTRSIPQQFGLFLEVGAYVWAVSGDSDPLSVSHSHTTPT